MGAQAIVTICGRSTGHPFQLLFSRGHQGTSALEPTNSSIGSGKLSQLQRNRQKDAPTGTAVAAGTAVLVGCDAEGWAAPGLPVEVDGEEGVALVAVGGLVVVAALWPAEVELVERVGGSAFASVQRE